jgi:hypothetical protein
VPLPGRYYRYRLDAIEAYELGEPLSNNNGAGGQAGPGKERS